MRCCIFISFVVTVTATIAAICGLIYTSVKYTDELRNHNNTDPDLHIGMIFSALGTFLGLGMLVNVYVYVECLDARPARGPVSHPSPRRVIAFAEPARVHENPMFADDIENPPVEEEEDAFTEDYNADDEASIEEDYNEDDAVTVDDIEANIQAGASDAGWGSEHCDDLLAKDQE
jgi:hypothetical protein